MQAGVPTSLHHRLLLFHKQVRTQETERPPNLEQPLHEAAALPRQACDEYFYLPARQEHRGTGGVFFDDLPVDQEAMDFATWGVLSRMKIFALSLRVQVPKYTPNHNCDS